ncbi:site-specific integrase [Aliiroseovarius sp. S1339]|uniref:tyrosine-type recombinase/integrase n=1 Tax=Aliiroseovarius sp. S1339 TaxID=2936990 RepID=UPI0020BEF606|nr:site-specific integrase [Aliiroseovarius sp. S1339]MCK8462408.1 site-specific integrase [Aliiroseovarius sp. S1339]
MAKIVKLRPTPKGEPRYGVRWKDETGKERQASFSTRREAQLFRSQKEVEFPRQRKNLKRNRIDDPSFAIIAVAYISSLKNPEPGEDPLEPVTIRGYKSVLQEHVFPVVARKRPSNIDGDDYKIIYKRCVKLGMSTRTRAEALRLLKATLTFAKDAGYIDFVPDNPIKKKKTRKEEAEEQDAAEKKYYTPDEVYTMLVAADNLASDPNKQTRKTWARYRPMVYLLVYTGARISEARAFRRQDYAPAEGRIHIRESAPEGTGSYETKTAAGRRWVPMNPELREPLETWLDTHDRRLVFGTTTDKPISLPTLYPRLLEALKDRADLLVATNADPRLVTVRRDRKFHAFRHHFASWLVKEGANLKQLQRYMGHSKASFTLDVYGHLFEDDGQELVARMSMKATETRNGTLPAGQQIWEMSNLEKVNSG